MDEQEFIATDATYKLGIQFVEKYFHPGIRPRSYSPRVEELDYSDIAATLQSARAAIRGMVSHLPLLSEVAAPLDATGQEPQPAAAATKAKSRR